MKNYQEIEDQELDDLFRTAHSESLVAPEFDQAFWSEMESILPEKENKKRVPVYFWWSSIAAFLLLSLTSIWWFLSAEHPNSLNELKAKQFQKHDFIQRLNTMESADRTELTPKVETQVVFANNPERKFQLRTLDDQNHMDLSAVNSNQETYSSPSIENKEFDQVYLVRKNIVPFEEVLPVKRTFDPMPFTQNDRFFLQLSTGIGKSYQREVANQNDWLFTTTLTGGIRTSIKQMELNAGVSIRTEFVDNIIWNRTTSDVLNGQIVPGMERFAARQLYSLEFPLALGWNGGLRHNLVAQIIPGIQIAGFGTAQFEQNEQVIEERKEIQNMNDSKTMTMEIGVAYNYRIGMRYQLGLACNMDVIRPFNTSYYLGEIRHFPINMQISVRRFLHGGK